MKKRTISLSLAAACVAAALFSSEVVVDKEKKEVRLPFFFSEHTRVIEVFGCSPGGPTHETVVIFTAKGSEIAEALEAIGARPPSFWEATHPQDFMHTQGDRILVLLRWSSHGHEYEVAAERLLWRTGESLPQPVLGFSYKAEKVKHGSPPEVKVPDCVEITMGGMGRQSSVSSVLVHPTALPFYMHHVSNIELNPVYEEKVAHMAHEKKGGTLVLRLVTESELCRFKQGKQSSLHWGYEKVYEEQLPIAQRIDKLKKEFVDLRNRINELLEKNDPQLQDDVKKLLASAGYLSWAIQKAYIDYYTPQWKFHRTLLRERLESFERNWRFGYDHLRKYTAERLQLAELNLQKTEQKEETPALDLKIALSEARLWELKTRRYIPLMEEEAASMKKRIEDEKKDNNAYLIKLLENDLLKQTIEIEKRTTQAALWKLKQQEVTAKLENSETEQSADAIRDERAGLEALLEKLEIRKQITELNDQIRWEEDAAQSQDPAERKNAQAKLKELKAKKKELEEKL